ncbi:hypothetical protein [Streptomyces showdoensis]|uniref:Uncharacterized protein n=1 Tax=Streptomyces showdoensis TaxID=68268 RepID=A0A2P2GNG7_STREW|nr:hypothetical protein [Streptomyces showdoensis]KKZ73024.1 hypothetical protein VO63_14665 [Streptomyces showdoensis]
MNLRSSWTLETGQTREDTRLTQTPTTLVNPVQVRSGILPGSYSGQWRLSGFWMTGVSAMTATVAEGRAVIQGDISQGAYPVTLPAAEPVTFAVGNAQYGRVDLVVLKIYDKLYDGLNRNEAVVEVIQGVPEQAPKAPAAPPRSLPLYEVLVPAGASAGNGGIPWNTSLKDLRTTVVAAGGILPVENAVLPGAYPGQYQDTPNNQFQRWDGGKWVAYPQAVGGVVPTSVPTASPGSYTGQYRAVADGPLQRWTGAAWAPAYPGPYFNDSLDAGYTVSTTYVNALVERAENPLVVSFVAPESKQAILSFGSRMELSLASGTTGIASSAFMCVRITQGATVVREVEDELAAMASKSADPTDAVSVSTTQRLYNLTPGQTYTVTAYYRTTHTNVRAWFDNTFIQVTPQY